jgi:hypothetical protein
MGGSCAAIICACGASLFCGEVGEATPSALAQSPLEKRNALTAPRPSSLVLKKFYPKSGIALTRQTIDF